MVSDEQIAEDDYLRLSDANNVVLKAQQSEGSRLADRIEFIIGLPEVLWDKPIQELGGDVLRSAGVDSMRPVDLRCRWDALGRDASGMALALEILVGTTALLGAVHTWIDAAERVAKLWKKLRRKHRPVLSLGSLKLLCALDLYQRLGNADGVNLIWAGDISGRNAVDLIYSDDDTYALIFSRQKEVWVYIVDSLGKVKHFTISSTDDQGFILGAGDSA